MDINASVSDTVHWGPADSTIMADQILEIITQYSLNKFDDSAVRLAAGTQTFLSVIGRFVEANQRVEACLPAFPFKSANKEYKVLGNLPDKAEELALQRLQSMCERIQQVYPPGCRVTIISDGITYNDLLCISDRDTWAYGEALRQMAAAKNFHHVAFSRMKDLLDISLPEDLREITYVANCTNFRRLLLNKFGRDDIDIDHEIATNPDIKLTYLGYRRFLESDLKLIFPPCETRTKNGYKRDVKFLAKQMLIRGYAFAGAVKHAFPNYLRLSIHESVGEHKVSMSLLNTQTGYTTPWHCTVAQLSDGEWISAPMGEFQKDERLELIYENGRPSYFKQKHVQGHQDLPSVLDSYLADTKQFSGYSSPTTSFSSEPSGCSTPNSLSPRDGSSLASTNQKLSSPFGRRLIPQIMDQLASDHPDQVVFSLASFHDGKLGFRDITARHFTQAIDKMAWWLHEQLGTPTSVQPIGYIGPHDLRHILLTYACVKAGFAALYLSPKNSVEGVKAVLDSLNCDIWAQPGEMASIPLVKEALRQRTMKIIKLPLLDELLDADSTPLFPYTKTFDEAIDDPFCYLHTSGSTGVPKPIPWSHGLIGTMDAIRLLPPVEGDGGLVPWTDDWKEGDRIYSSFPMSHGAGIIMNILLPALFNLHCILGPTGVLPNLDLVESLADNAKIDIWSMVPSLVDELGESPEILDKFKSSKFICASGGPVSPDSAGKVNDVIRVLNLTGTTEGLFIGNLVVPREDWLWFAFHPYSGFEFKQVEPGMYEHWVHRNDNWPLFQGIFHTFPEKQSINFKDLYKKHPTKPNLWAFTGRNDDLVVLSNGYKISPLDTEAFISTHPAIEGCLVIGAGKPQAGLLVELKDPESKTEELLENIWATVEEVNMKTRHTHQLRQDYITFAEADKPFIRTDKGTVKRAATLKIYADYIERFYQSRSDDVPVLDVDTNSIESIQDCIRKAITSSFPSFQQAGLEDDFFDMGLDSLGVFAAVKIIRVATKLGNHLAPRHLYANPTISKLSSAILTLVNERKLRADQDDESAFTTTRSMMAQHHARQSFKLNALDYVNPNHYMGLMFYFPLQEGVNFTDVFDNLQQGLNRTFDLIPALGGKMIKASSDEIGYKKGDLYVSIPPPSLATSVHNRLMFKDLSDSAVSFDQLRDGGFVPSAIADSLLLRDDPFPQFPTDIVIAQANFIKGGCILAVDINHCCLDGIGAIIAIKAWAENCRFLQGDESATCEWYDQDSFNHSLPEIVHNQEGWQKSWKDVDPGTWGFLPFQPTEDVLKQQTTTTLLPTPPPYTLHSEWPLKWAKRPTNTTLFVIPPEKVELLKQDVQASASTSVSTSISDIIQGFLWRSALRARYIAATNRGESFTVEDMSILELPTDGRPYFSSLLPSTYMGSMLIMSRSTMSIEKLCSPETTISEIAQVLRETASKITPSLVHDVFTLLQSLPDYSRFSTANMGLSHMHAMISNMILFQTSEICFGKGIFGNNGAPESMRPQLQRGNGRFRFLVIPPMRKDGGVEMMFGTYPEELEVLTHDEEFMKYATLVDVD